MWYLLTRGAQMLFILVFLSIALFGLLSSMPGNPVDLLITSNPHIKPEDVTRLKKLRGLDRPWYVQYARWLWGYYDPAKPAHILPIDPLEIKQNSEGEIDLMGKLIDPNFLPSTKQCEKWLAQIWPDWRSSQKSVELGQALNEGKISEILTLLGQHDGQMQTRFVTLLQDESAKNLKVEGLFGAKFMGQTLHTASFPQLESSSWFSVTNSYGQKKVGRVVHHFLDDSLRKPDILFSINSQIVENENKPFELDLKKFAVDKDAKMLKFELLPDSVGTLSSDGIFSHQFTTSGQTVVTFAVSDSFGHKQNMAFDIEHGVIPNPANFNKGFLYFFAGDRYALGFSNTYKRPVYDLLFGTPSVCGDGKVDPGETCDDGNLKGNDGCGIDCFKEGDSFLTKTNATIGAKIVNSGRIGNTIQLMLPALLLSLLIAIPLGVFSAYRQYSILDYIVNIFAFIGISLPVFWFGIMMIYVFAEVWQLFPAGGVQTPGIYSEGTIKIILDRLYYAILPTMVLSIFYVGRWLRYMRASMLEVLPKDYIRTARAKGLSERAVILRHAFRNALIPVVTVLALSIPSLFGGAVLTETVFSWPGVGRLQYESVMSSDYYVAIIVFLVAGILVMVGNLLADLVYVLVDPRIRKK